MDGVVAAQRFLTTPSAHASGLIPAVRAVLAEAGASREELEGVAVGAGPGSFTGARIGAAAAKGLASALRLPLYATSSLRAAAFAVETLDTGPNAGALPPELFGPKEELAAHGAAAGPLPVLPSPLPRSRREIRYVLFDARGGRVYGACYDVGADGPAEVVAPHGGDDRPGNQPAPAPGNRLHGRRRRGPRPPGGGRRVRRGALARRPAPGRGRARLLFVDAGGRVFVGARVPAGVEAGVTLALHVRKAEEEDLAAVVEIEKESFGRPWRLETFATLLARPSVDFLVAEAGAGRGRVRGAPLPRSARRSWPTWP